MEVVRSIARMESLRDDWNALADLAEHALLRHEWLVAAARTLHSDGDLFVIADGTGGEISSLAPLAWRRVAGIERLELLGAATLHEPAGFLSRSVADQERLIGRLLELRRPLMLQRLQDRQIAIDFAAGSRGHGTVVAKPTTPWLGVDLQGGEAARPSGKLRYDIGRARRRLAEHGSVRLEVAAPRPSEIDALLDRFVSIEGSGWKGRQGSSLLARPQLQAFFRTYAKLAATSGYLRMFLLFAGARLAAVQFAVEIYRRMWVLKIGFQDELAHCSPGFLLTAEAIAYAGQQGLRSYEFLGVAEAWEERWRPGRRNCDLVMFYPWSLRGFASLSADAVGATWRRLTSTPGGLPHS